MLPALLLLFSVAPALQQNPAEPSQVRWPGTLVPSAAEEVHLWPEAWQGELMFLEVLPHGSLVEQGQVIARFDDRAFKRQLEDAERAVESAHRSFESAMARAELDEQATEWAIQEAERAVEQAHRDLEQWTAFQRKHNQASAALSADYTRYGIEDATDELQQLEAMYTEDELTDATEEIVLRRSRRNLAASKRSAELQQQQRAFTAEVTWPLTTEAKEWAVERAERKLHQTVRQAELDQEAREVNLEQLELAVHRAEEQLDRLAADEEIFAVRAPRAGLLLHGGAEDYHPGKVAPRHQRGSRAQVRTALFTIAEPDHLGVALRIKESQLSFAAGKTVTVEGIAQPGLIRSGRLQVDPFPLPSSAAGGENQYHAWIALDRPVVGAVPGQRVHVTLGER